MKVRNLMFSVHVTELRMLIRIQLTLYTSKKQENAAN